MKSDKYLKELIVRMVERAPGGLHLLDNFAN